MWHGCELYTGQYILVKTFQNPLPSKVCKTPILPGGSTEGPKGPPDRQTDGYKTDIRTDRQPDSCLSICLSVSPSVRPTCPLLHFKILHFSSFQQKKSLFNFTIFDFSTFQKRKKITFPLFHIPAFPIFKVSDLRVKVKVIHTKLKSIKLQLTKFLQIC